MLVIPPRKVSRTNRHEPLGVGSQARVHAYICSHPVASIEKVFILALEGTRFPSLLTPQIYIQQARKEGRREEREERKETRDESRERREDRRQFFLLVVALLLLLERRAERAEAPGLLE